MDGQKNDHGKPQVAEMMQDFPAALEAVAEVWTHGAMKYSPGGWRSVEGNLIRYTNAMQRHFLAEGIDRLDPSSELMHAAHVAWNALCRLEIMLAEDVMTPALREELISEQIVHERLINESPLVPPPVDYKLSNPPLVEDEFGNVSTIGADLAPLPDPDIDPDIDEFGTPISDEYLLAIPDYLRRSADEG
jgi:hypothetical protein